MAPPAPTSSSSMTTTRLRRRNLKATRTHNLKKKNQNLPLPPEISKIPDVSSEDSPPSPSPSSLSSSSSEIITTDEPRPSASSSCCSTPKGRKFRIPEIATCPPAPKKKKPSSLFSGTCSRRRSPISFFAPPDLELFFFLALPDNISV
ncbi:cyclin-dependent protein kinase inhibitor SMR9 [Prosopis cineraria]|uniref:cyclin-dependent protein kinase inhibitor SMR9 n=1 Tax=Prosopis cineraria TaxID=364024 RepID=UPI0024100A67|nr:cyclin-dependent protein kinase inhibitor SMR9 [Prosopis cineraria]